MQATATGDVVGSREPRTVATGGQTAIDGGVVFPTDGLERAQLFREMAHRSHPETKKRFENPRELASFVMHKERMRHLTRYEKHVKAGIMDARGDGLLALYEFFLWPVPDRITPAPFDRQPTREDRQHEHLIRVRRDIHRMKRVRMEPGNERGFNPDFILNAFDSRGRQYVLNPHAAFYFTHACGKDPIRYVEKMIDFRRTYPMFNVVMIVDVPKEELQMIFDDNDIPHRVEDICDEYVYIHNGAVTPEEIREEKGRAKEFVRDLVQRPGTYIERDVSALIGRMTTAFEISGRVEIANRINEGKLRLQAEMEES